MNILFINDPSPYGGASGALVQLVKHLTAMGCTVTVCTSRTPALDSKLRACGAKVISCGHVPVLIGKSPYALKTLAKIAVFGCERLLGKNRLAVRKIERSIDLSKIDIIHTNSARSDLGALIGKRYGIPHIVHIREFGVQDYSCISLNRNYIRDMNANTEVFVAVSDAVKKSWITRGINKNKTVRIYDGVDIDSIKIKKQNLGDDNKLKLIMAGAVVETKGQHICIKAIRLLPHEIRKNVILDICGWENPRYRAYLEKLISNCGLEGQVRFLGIRDGMGDILCNYDVGVMASRCEGFGLVTVEYMAAGLCVVASDSGANPELVVNGENGMLFDREKPQQLARCIEKLYNDRTAMKKMALCGHKKAVNGFTAQKNAKNVYDIYRKMCKQSKGEVK